jgi:hypothetical protein
MAIRISCPTCEKALAVPDSMAGKRAKCPACGGALGIPAESAEDSAEPVPAPAKAPARTIGSGRTAAGRRSRPRPAGTRGTAAQAGAEKTPLWRRLMWVGAIPLILVIGWIAVSLDDKHRDDMAELCRGRAEQTFAAGAKDQGLVRFLIGEFHADCLATAQVQERVTRRSQRWTYDVDKYLAAMRQRIERELANPNSELVRRYRSQPAGGG